MSKHQLLDDNINSLIRAFTKKDLTCAISEVAYLYNEAFIVPSSQILWVRIKGIDRIIIALHNCSLFYAHHGSITLTTHHILRLFTWRNLKEDVAKFCSNCTVYLSTKPLCAKSPGLLTPVPLAIRPLQRLSVNCLTNLFITVGTRYQHIMIAVDSFTRFLFVIPLQQLIALLIARALTLIFVLFGAPTTLLSDKEREFNNSIIKLLTNNWGLRHIFVYTKNPQANGQTEVSVRIVTQGLMTCLVDARLSSSPLLYK